MRAEITKKFREHYGREPRIFRAPGRVNLIGEHTDYNDGFVFPMALNFYTTVALAPRADRTLKIWSEDMQESVQIDLSAGLRKREHWSDYVAGIADVLRQHGLDVGGADAHA